MVEDDLGEIKDFNVGHQSLEEIDPDLSLSAMLLWKDDFESRISDVTLFLILRNLDQKCGESVCLALRNILFLFLMYRLIVVVIHGGSEGLIVTTH